MREFDIIVMGASVGGMNAIKTVLSGLPGAFQTPVAIVQHRESDGKDHLSKLLQTACPLKVLEAEDKQAIRPGRVYLAPRNYHLLVGKESFELTTDAAVHFARPSIDMLFESAADTFGEHVIGVILTGANEDGANGISAIKRMGGMAFVQDPATAENGAMPRAAIAATPVDRVLPLDQISRALIGHTMPAAIDGRAP